MRKLIELTRCRVAIAAAFAVATGEIVAAGVSVALLLPFIGAFLVAAGALALNEWQERDVDARMKRTRARPLPAGRMSPRSALAVAGALLVAGLGLITPACSNKLVAPLVIVVIVVGYNGVYTPLKRVTSFASVPGALFGALPPLVGWAAAGAPLDAPLLWAMVVFLFLWQMPHVWLLALAFPEDARRSGLPNLVARLGTRALARLTFSWILATIVAGPCLLLYYSPARNVACVSALAAACVFLSVKARSLLTDAALEAARMRRLFAGVNLFGLVALGVLAIGSWI